jgi:hypothetical protein
MKMPKFFSIAAIWRIIFLSPIKFLLHQKKRRNRQIIDENAKNGRH